MNHSEHTNLVALIELIYQGATDISRWPAILADLCQWMGASACGIWTPWRKPEDGGLLLSHGLSQQASELWVNQYFEHNLWAQRAIEKNLLTTGNVVRDQELVTEEEFLASIWYQDFLCKVGLGRLLSGVIFSAQEIIALPVLCCCIRPFDDPFTANDEQRMKILLPHLSRALGVMLRLRDTELKQTSMQAVLDRINYGVVLFDKYRHPTFLNAPAKQLIDLKDGLGLRKRNGDENSTELVAANEKANTLLTQAINEAIAPDILSTRHFSSAVVIPRPSGKAPFLINFSSLSNFNDLSLTNGHPVAIAFINDCAADVRLNGSALKDAYALTEAEVRAAEFLMNGCSIEEAAQQLGVSVNTIKTQLRQLHDKTGTNNRARLVKLLLSMTSAKSN